MLNTLCRCSVMGITLKNTNSKPFSLVSNLQNVKLELSEGFPGKFLDGDEIVHGYWNDMLGS